MCSSSFFLLLFFGFFSGSQSRVGCQGENVEDSWSQTCDHPKIFSGFIIACIICALLAFEYHLRKRVEADKASRKQEIREVNGMALKKIEETLKMAIENSFEKNRWENWKEAVHLWGYLMS